MLILWIRKRKADRQSGDEMKAARFSQEPEDAIKQFRLEHPDIAVSNARDIVTEDGNLLATIQEVKLWGNIQN
jgi:hypothetical protein